MTARTNSVSTLIERGSVPRGVAVDGGAISPPAEDIVRANRGITDTETPREIGKRSGALQQVGTEPATTATLPAPASRREGGDGGAGGNRAREGDQGPDLLDPCADECGAAISGRSSRGGGSAVDRQRRRRNTSQRSRGGGGRADPAGDDAARHRPRLDHKSYATRWRCASVNRVSGSPATQQGKAMDALQQAIVAS